jgi:transposase
MDYYAGIDVSLKISSVCVVGSNGKVVCEAKVPSEPEPLIAWFGNWPELAWKPAPLSQWLHSALCGAGFAVVLLETRHVKRRSQLVKGPAAGTRREAVCSAVGTLYLEVNDAS